MSIASKRASRDLCKEFRVWAKDTGVINQTTTGYQAIALNSWLFNNIEEILDGGYFKELQKLIDYYGISRNQMIALFDFATADSTVDWKTAEVSDLADFLMEAYMSPPFLTKVGGTGNLTFTGITFDSIVVTHMKEFAQYYPWDKFPYPSPSQLDMVAKVYQKIDRANSDDNKPSGGMWEWVLQYGEASPVPFHIIMTAVNDAIVSGNANIIAYYTTADFLRNQALVTIDGDDTKLCDFWEKLMDAVESASASPDDLFTAYTNQDENPITYKELYKRIYNDLVEYQCESVEGIRGLIQTGDKGVPSLTLHNDQSVWYLLSMYQTIVANGDVKKNDLPVVPGMIR